MSIKQWFISRLSSELAKTQPIVKLPQAKLTTPKGVVVADTATSHQRVLKQNAIGPHKEQLQHWPRTNAGIAGGFAGPVTSAITNAVSPKRIDSMVGHEAMHQMFQSLDNKYGKGTRIHTVENLLQHADAMPLAYIAAALQKLGYERKYSNFPEELFNYLHTYQTDPVNRKRIQDEIPTAWGKRSVDIAVKRSWKKILQEAEKLTHQDFQGFALKHQDKISKLKNNVYKQLQQQLKKAFDPQEWAHFASHHGADYDKMVDHTMHTVNGTVPDAYKKMIDSPTTVPGAGPGKGVAVKMLHNLNGVFDPAPVMTKLYHKVSEPDLTHFGALPLSGWSTMATKGLYNAAGIGHMAEDVTAHVHNGVPLTVHQFAANVNEAKPRHFDRVKPNINPAHLLQIGAMDFLTDNADRHNENVMFHEKSNQTGHHPLLAIDHERSFQYSSDKNKPEKYLDGLGGFFDHLERTGKSVEPEHYNELRQWWNTNAPNIKQEMERQLTAIKDPSIQEHVRRNFDNRYGHIDKWAKGNDQELFSGSVPNIAMPDKYTGSLDEVNKKLPVDHLLASRQILQASLEHPSKDRRAFMEDLFRSRVKHLTPEQLHDLYVSGWNNPVLGKVMRESVTSRLASDPEFSKRYQTQFESFLQQPENSSTFPFLRHHFQKTAENK